jgi:hypothetical protein
MESVGVAPLGAQHLRRRLGQRLERYLFVYRETRICTTALEGKLLFEYGYLEWGILKAQ